MQLHPRILFASLQRIHLEIEHGTREAPEMILKLSDLLSYLLYDSEAEKVPLIKEVQMIENYLALKKLENNHHPDIRFDASGDLHRHWISPGFFLPLLETVSKEATPSVEHPRWRSTFSLKGSAPMIMFSLKTNVPRESARKRPCRANSHPDGKRTAPRRGVTKMEAGSPVRRHRQHNRHATRET